jgi:hypothetical protein
VPELCVSRPRVSVREKIDQNNWQLTKAADLQHDLTYYFFLPYICHSICATLTMRNWITKCSLFVKRRGWLLVTPEMEAVQLNAVTTD